MHEYHSIDRMAKVEPSGTLKLDQMAREEQKKDQYRRIDKRVIKFTVGEPDMKTPQFIIDGAKRALDEGKTHYTDFRGIPELREGLTRRYEEKGFEVTPDEILVMPTKLGIFGGILIEVENREGTILISPYWVSYEPMVNIAGGKVSFVDTSQGDGTFKVDEDELNDTVDSNTKMIIINTPNNPTGRVLSKKELKAIADLAVDHDLLVISDEVYEELLYDDNEHISIATMPDMWHRTITVSGLSKSFAMTGWRMGWAVANKDIMKDLWKFQQHTLTCATSFAQYGALEIFKQPEEALRHIELFRAKFTARRKLICKMLQESEAFDGVVPEGTFYAFPKYHSDLPSMEFAQYLLEKTKVAVTPGSVFGPGGEGHIRISFATPYIKILQGIERIDQEFGKIKKLEKANGKKAKACAQ